MKRRSFLALISALLSTLGFRGAHASPAANTLKFTRPVWTPFAEGPGGNEYGTPEPEDATYFGLGVYFLAENSATHRQSVLVRRLGLIQSATCGPIL